MPYPWNDATKTSPSSSKGSWKDMTGWSAPSSLGTDALNLYNPYNHKNIGWDNDQHFPCGRDEKRLSQASASSSAPSDSLPRDPATSSSSSAAVPPNGPGSSQGTSRRMDGIKRARRSTNEMLVELWRDSVEYSTPLDGRLLPKSSPWGPIAPPARRSGGPPSSPKSRLNPCSAPFVPAAPVAVSSSSSSLPLPPSSLNAKAEEFCPPGLEILEADVLCQFPPYLVRRHLHYNNHSQWSQMLAQVQRANPMHFSAIQQFAESEKQMYREEL